MQLSSRKTSLQGSPRLLTCGKMISQSVMGFKVEASVDFLFLTEKKSAFCQIRVS